jgi:hypothetical protein
MFYLNNISDITHNYVTELSIINPVGRETNMVALHSILNHFRVILSGDAV